MFDIGFLELIVVGVVGLLVLGPEKLPGAIRSVSRTVNGVKRYASAMKTEIEHDLRIQEMHENLKKAEEMGMRNLPPDVQASVDHLKAAADSVNNTVSEQEKNGPSTKPD